MNGLRCTMDISFPKLEGLSIMNCSGSTGQDVIGKQGIQFSIHNIMKYLDILSKKPELDKCFFAFNKKQFEEGKIKSGIEKSEDIFHWRAGLYGTKEGITKYLEFYTQLAKEISEECDPQEVYDYELSNCECKYSRDDTPAIETIIHYFGIETAKKVKRKFKVLNIK